jgi:dTDP-4-amino-4,6-dideoxygalactose transaminase
LQTRILAPAGNPRNRAVLRVLHGRLGGQVHLARHRSFYCPGEIISAFLYAQFEQAGEIIAHRRSIYDAYRTGLAPLAEAVHVTLPTVPGDAANGHIFWLLARVAEARGKLLAHLNGQQINAVFHYVPLHSAPAGRRFGRMAGELPVTDNIFVRLVRLPIKLGMTDAEIARVGSLGRPTPSR